MDTVNKYNGIWAEYEKCYDSMEQVQEVKRNRAKLQSIEEQSEWHGVVVSVLAKKQLTDVAMEVEIKDFDTELERIRTKKGNFLAW